MSARHGLPALLLATVACFGASTIAAGAATLAEARGLYESAQYEQALDALDTLDPTQTANLPDRQAVRRYKALCLIALDRTHDAEQTVEDMVREEPRAAFGNDVPPRMHELVFAARKKLAPAIAREGYERGRDLYQRGQYADARRELTAAIAILDDPALGLAVDPAIKDLRLLADGFLKLSTASAPGTASTARAAGSSPAGTQAGAAPSSPAQTDAAGAVEADATYVPPKALFQPVPAFNMASMQTTMSPRDGEIEVDVGIDGRVTSARMRVPLTPVFDMLLMQTARNDWRYQPATRQGIAVPSKVRVKVVLKR
jgi:tetratricopeptide (TPR) repeat protein